MTKESTRLALYQKLALKIQTTVQEYWDEYRKPLGYRLVVPAITAKLPASQRDAFEEYLKAGNYVVVKRADKTASRYCFPPLEPNQIDAEAIEVAMTAVEMARLETSKRRRRAPAPRKPRYEEEL